MLTPWQPKVSVQIANGPQDTRSLIFTNSFQIGRVVGCAICIQNEYVSRSHAEVALADGHWTVRDLGSSNGVYVAGERVQSVVVDGRLTFRLGVAGPSVSLTVEEPPAPPAIPPPPVLAVQPNRNMERYFGKLAEGETPGEHTMMVRRAFHQVQAKQHWRYGWIMAALGVLVLSAGGYAYYLHLQAGKNKALAENLFYSMKALDVNIATVERVVLDANSQQGKDAIRKYENQRKEMERNYDQFLTTLRVYDPKMTPQDRLILRVARIFGECELAMPPGFAAEVGNYIKKWKSSGRLASDVRLAKERNYNTFIAKEFLAQDLPPQLFYLALQESNFDPYATGPMTRFGMAKGMWQFIPQTAAKYGLQIGPLVDFNRPDPNDDRHHYDRATVAAARYIKDLYSSDAQASGLLVMSCYNWGERQVLPLIQSMPANPRERNFWQLLTKYRDKIPQETYDYVFYITSAAVIGEDPRLFGFDFDNPLAHLETQ